MSICYLLQHKNIHKLLYSSSRYLHIYLNISVVDPVQGKVSASMTTSIGHTETHPSLTTPLQITLHCSRYKVVAKIQCKNGSML